MHRFALLHISDLHLAGGLGKHRAYLAEAAAAWTFKFAQGRALDAILITGDLADDGTQNSLDLANAFVVGAPDPVSPVPYLMANGLPTLAGIKASIWCMPGNHDRYQRAIKPPWILNPGCGNRLFDRVFNSTWNPTNCVRGVTLTAPSGSDKLTILSADFCLRTDTDADPQGNWKAVAGRGMAYSDVLDELAKQTVQASSSGSTVLWALHFPPGFYQRYPGNLLEQNTTSPYLNLINETAVLDKAMEVNVTHVLSGHTHKRRHYQPLTRHRVFIHCAGSASRPGNYSDISLHAYYVSADAAMIVGFDCEDYGWDPGKKQFVYVAPIINGRS